MRKCFGPWKRMRAGRALAMAILGGAIGALCASAQQQSTGDLEVLQVRPDFYMIAGAGGNIGVQLGPIGVILVDTGSAQMTDQVLAAIGKLTNLQIRYIIDTSADADHVGGNEKLSRAGKTILSGAVGNPAFGEDVIGNGGAASVFAHDNVIARMSAEEAGTKTPGYPVAAWPTKTYTAKFYTMSLNGQGIEVIHQPAAHSDGDSLVLFRQANVIVTGDLFDPTHFPVIKSEWGGTIQGELDALNHLLELTIPPYPFPWMSERTYLIPGHGPISDHHDLLEYRDMVTIVRDVIQDMINKGMTLELVKAANPTKGYNARYGANSGPWTTEMFVTAVYKGLSGKAQ